MAGSKDKLSLRKREVPACRYVVGRPGGPALRRRSGTFEPRAATAQSTCQYTSIDSGCSRYTSSNLGARE